ncbi:hypothetical protein ACMA1I_16105 [Pontibacter sp. 13R65]|uniref:hypothetical protein n=1 Tax=Pontibacter sp. 13R65 TaxID=3127458 RepID=UPI00301DF9A5
MENLSKHQLKEEKSMSNFIQDCINGDALLSEVDDYIDIWHESDTELPLHEFLGMTKREYALFVEDEIYLGSIVTAHMTGDPIEEIIQNQYAMAARSDSQAKSARLEQWLRSEKLWD